MVYGFVVPTKFKFYVLFLSLLEISEVVYEKIQV